MTVKELITLLDQFNPQTLVLVNGVDGGFKECADPKQTTVHFSPEYKEYLYANTNSIPAIIIPPKRTKRNP